MYGVNVLLFVEEFNKAAYAALITEVFLNNLGFSFVAELNVNTRVEESLFSETFFEYVKIIYGRVLKDFYVRVEPLFLFLWIFRFSSNR